MVGYSNCGASNCGCSGCGGGAAGVTAEKVAENDIKPSLHIYPFIYLRLGGDRGISCPNLHFPHFDINGKLMDFF